MNDEESGQINFSFLIRGTLPIDDKGFQVSCLEGKKRRNEEEKKRRREDKEGREEKSRR